MSMVQLASIVSRVLFAGAFLLLAVSVLERIVVAFGYTILRGHLTGGRLLEIAAMIVVFVIPILLMQILEELKTRGG